MEIKYPSQLYRLRTGVEAKWLVKELARKKVPFSTTWEALLDAIRRRADAPQNLLIDLQNIMAANALADPKFGRNRLDSGMRYAAEALLLLSGEIEGAEEHAHTIRCGARFLGDGEKVYELSEGLTQRLLNTDVRGIPTSMLQLPYGTICVRVPKSAGLNYAEFMLTEEPSMELGPKETEWLKMVAMAEGDEEALARAGVIDNRLPRGWSVIGMNVVTNGRGGYGLDATPPAGITFLENEDLAALCNRMGIDFSKPRNVGERINRLLINLVLYLTWPDTGEEFVKKSSPEWEAQLERVKSVNGYKRERERERLAKIDRDERVYLGAKLPFLTDDEATGRKGDELLVRTLVAGHWKMQPCGEGRKDRKLIRVEPYWRGPLDAPVSNPTKVVK